MRPRNIPRSSTGPVHNRRREMLDPTDVGCYEGLRGGKHNQRKAHPAPAMARTVCGLMMIFSLLCFLPLHAASSASPQIRVALMNFACDDNSQRSVVAINDLTATLQAELSAEAAYDWVERASLDKAEQELKLGGFGLIDRSEALKAGRWAKADWAIFGRFSTNSAAGRTVALEVVNLSCADVLAETKLVLPDQTNRPLRVTSAEASRLTSALASLLKQADQARAANRHKPSVAFLFLSPAAAQTSLPRLETEFRGSLLAAATNRANLFHLLQFQRAGEAMDEADLVLSGLVESESDASEKVAQWYVWGTYSVASTRRPGRQPGLATDEKVLTAQLQVWDGKNPTRVATVQLTNVAPEAAMAARLAESLQPLLMQARTAGAAAEGIRRRISSSLVDHAVGLMAARSTPALDSREGRKQWLDVVQVLETACFFDPGYDQARELWTRVRWGRLAENGARNQFFFERRRSEAWQRHADQFGFRSGLNSSPSDWRQTNSIASEYVLSAWRLCRIFQFSQYDQARWGVPLDSGARELGEWQRQFVADLQIRLLKAPKDPLVAREASELFHGMLSRQGNAFVIADAKQRQRALDLLLPGMLEDRERLSGYFDQRMQQLLELHFKDLGQPGGEKAVITQFLKQSGPKKTVAETVKLPRISELDPAENADLMAVPPWIAPVPVRALTPDARQLPLPPGAQGIRSMAFYGGKLWFALEMEEGTSGVGATAAQADHELRPLKGKFGRLWVANPATGSLERHTGALATNNIRDLLVVDDELWVALADAGVAAWNNKTGGLRRFGAAEGLAQTNQYTLAANTRGIFALGGMFDFMALNHAAANWEPVKVDPPRQFGMPATGDNRKLTGSGDYLLLYSLGLLLGNSKSNQWNRLDPSITTASPLQGLGNVFCVASDKQGGFWVGSESGLHGIDGNKGTTQSQFLNWPIRINTEHWNRLATDVRSRHQPSANFLGQVNKIMDARRQVAVARKASAAAMNPFEPTSRLPGLPYALAVDGDFVWVITRNGDQLYESRILLYSPTNRFWVGGVAFKGYGMKAATGDGKLWLARTTLNRLELLALDKQEFLTTPRAQWVPDRVSPAEASGLIAGLTPHQQAIARFFANDPAAAAPLLAAEAREDPSSETLFLLTMAHDENGLNQPDETARYAARLLKEYPESVYARYLVSKQKPAQQPTPKP